MADSPRTDAAETWTPEQGVINVAIICTRLSLLSRELERELQASELRAAHENMRAQTAEQQLAAITAERDELGERLKVTHNDISLVEGERMELGKGINEWRELMLDATSKQVELEQQLAAARVALVKIDGKLHHGVKEITPPDEAYNRLCAADEAKSIAQTALAEVK